MEHIVLNLIDQRRDLSLSLNQPDYSEYEFYGISDWAKKKVNLVKIRMKNITNWKNKMYEYEGEIFRSIYETYIVAKLKEYEINYSYEDKIFPYYFNKKIRIDVTDFYIPSAKLVLEVKDKYFRKYINSREDISKKFYAMKNAVLKAGYNYALIDSQSSLTYLLMAYNLISFDEEFLENEIIDYD